MVQDGAREEDRIYVLDFGADGEVALEQALVTLSIDEPHRISYDPPVRIGAVDVDVDGWIDLAVPVAKDCGGVDERYTLWTVFGPVSGTVSYDSTVQLWLDDGSGRAVATDLDQDGVPELALGMPYAASGDGEVAVLDARLLWSLD